MSTYHQTKHNNCFICKICKNKVAINKNTLRLGSNNYTHLECSLEGKDKFNVANNDISILLPQNISSPIWHQPIEVNSVRAVILSKFESFISTTTVSFGGRSKTDDFDEQVNRHNQAALFEGTLAFIEISERIYIDPKKEFQKFRKKYYDNPKLLEKLYWLSTITNQQIDFSIPVDKVASFLTKQRQYSYT